MRFSELSNTWKCVCACVTAAAALCALSIGFDERYAKAADQREMQRQMYVMQLSVNISNYQNQINYLRSQPQTPAIQAQIAWLQQEIAKMQRQMMNQ